MATVDQIISDHMGRVTGYGAVVDLLVKELRTFVDDRDSGLYLPGIKNADGSVTSGLDLSRILFPTYSAPAKDNTPFPVYEPPTAAKPVKPNLSSIGGVTLPAKRTEPTLNLSGLFQQTPPNPNLPDFNEQEPDLLVDELVAEMGAIAAPVLRNITFPTITPLTIRAMPTVDVPDYDAPVAPTLPGDPQDYAKKFDDSYRQMLPEMQAYIDDRVTTYINAYAPEYDTLRATLQTKINAALDGGGALPDQFEQAMYTRARGRVEKEYQAVENGLLEAHEKAGFIKPPGAVMAGMLMGRLKSAESLANQATDIYVERLKVEAQFYQFVLGQAYAHVDGIRNGIVGYIGVVASTMQQAISYANDISEKLAKVFDHLIARAQIAVSVMAALDAQYQTKLKAALSRLDGYKLELEAEKAKKDVEIAVVQALESQVKVESLQVERYSALIEAVSRKGALEELKLKGYQVRADVFKNNTDAKIAGFDVYKAALDGDKSKLEGELAKVQVYESLIKTDQLNLEAQTSVIEAQTKANDGKIKIYQSESDVYKMASEIALNKFTAYSEVKKLHQEVYGQELSNAIESFKADFEAVKAKTEILVEQYKLSVSTAIEEAKLDLTKLQVAEKASESAVGAYQSMASSSMGALTSVVSSAVSA